MSECIYSVITNWKELENYNKEKFDSFVARIARKNNSIYEKILKKQKTILFKGSDSDKAEKIKSLLVGVGIQTIVEKISIGNEYKNNLNTNKSTIVDDINTICDTVFRKIFYYIRFIAIFPVMIFSRLSKKDIPIRVSYAILMVAAYFGLYDVTLGVVLRPIYQLSYDYSLKSFMATTAVFVVTAVVKGIASFSVVALTGIGDFVNKILELLGNGLIALTAQTILLKIAQQGFLLKYGLSAGFCLGVFESSRRLGEKIVTLTIFIYILLPVVVASEAYVFDQVTGPQIEAIKTEYKKIGGVTGMTKTAVFGAAGAAWEHIKNTIMSDTGNQKNEYIQKVKSFLMIVLEGTLYILFSVLFLSIISPFVSYKLFKYLSINIINNSYYMPLFSKQRRNT